MAPDREAFAGCRLIVPGAQWGQVSAESSGWSVERLAALALDLADGRSSALMLVHSGRVVFQCGEIARKSSVASVRKSLIGILYGVFIAEGRIAPSATLAELEIEDLTPLTQVERRATLWDLLRARSGVYLPSVYDTAAAGLRGAATCQGPTGSTTIGTSTFWARSLSDKSA